jgi:glutathione S-transferase
MTATSARRPALSASPVIRNARAEVAWWQGFLELLQTVPGSWRSWDDRMTGANPQERAAEEAAEALRHGRAALDAVLACHITGTIPGEPA